jgi:hypothetical protein
MSVIAQLFTLRRRVRSALDLPVAEWGEEESGPGILEGIAAKLRGLLRQPATRAIMIIAMSTELAFAAVAAPGHESLIDQHRRHLRQAWEYVRAFGSDIDGAAVWCTHDTAAAANEKIAGH